MHPDTARDVLMTPGMDRMLSLLSKRRRRLILLSLNRNARLTEDDVIVRGKRDIEKVEAELVHNHLPKLEEAGYIKWDPETGEISKGPRFEEIEPLLTLMENHSDELPPDWP